jgi:hypothetical protein
LGAFAAILLAALSAGYYFSVYLPARDARLDAERRLEKSKVNSAAQAEQIRLEAQRQAEQARISAEQQELERRRQEEKLAVQRRYRICVDGAVSNYEAVWAAECKRLGEKSIKDHANCVSKGETKKELCDLMYIRCDASGNCTLPRAIAADLESDLNGRRDLCLQEAKIGLQ